MENNVTDVAEKKKKVKKNRGIRYIWIYAALTILPFIAMIIVDFVSSLNDSSSFLNNMTRMGNALFATIMYISMFSIVECATIRLFTCMVRKDRGVLIKNLVTWIVMGVSQLVTIPTLAFLIYKGLDHITTDSYGFLGLFNGVNDYLGYVLLGCLVYFILIYVLFLLLYLKKTKPVRMTVKEEVNAIRTEKKRVQMEEQEKKRIEKEEQEKKKAEEREKLRLENLAKEEENKKRLEEERRVLEEKKKEEDALLAIKAQEEEKKKEEERLLALQKKEEEEKALAIKRAEEEKRREEEALRLKAEKEEKERLRMEALYSGKDESRKYVYLFFSLIFIPVMLLESLFTFVASDSELILISISISGIAFIVNLVFMILAYVNSKKISLALKELGYNLLISNVLVFLWSFVLDFFGQENGSVSVGSLLFLFPLIALIMLIVFQVRYKKHKKDDRILSFLGILVPVIFLLVVGLSGYRIAPFCFALPMYSIIITIILLVPASILLLLSYPRYMLMLDIVSKCPRLVKDKILPEEKLALLNAQLEEANKNGDTQKAEELSKQIAELSKTTKEISYEGESYFDGKLLQLIGYKILGNIITGITFGFGFPWAICFVKRWTVKHTVVNGRRLAFDGKGAQLFGKFIIWVLLTLVTFGIYAFWLNIKMEKWVASHTHFEDEVVSETTDEKEDKSTFDGRLIQLIGHNIVAFLMIVFTFGIAYPWAECRLLRWKCKHTVVDGKREAFDGKGVQLFGKYILWVFLTIITFGIYALWLGIKMRKWFASHTHFYKD